MAAPPLGPSGLERIHEKQGRQRHRSGEHVVALCSVLSRRAAEGAETVVFYIGIAPAIPLLSLVAGILGAFALLVIIGFLIIRFSVRLPLHYFFLVATVLIYYLAFKIAGQSIHSLQLVGILPTHIATGLPAVNILGMSSTWETFVPQMAILIVILVEVVITETQRVMKNLKRAATTRENTL
jgi:high-affinity iron transporter